jgi:hypothetical protein
MIYSAVITLGANAIQITGASGVTTWPTGALARRIFIEPLRGNTHAAWVGDLNVSKNGTGASISEIAAPLSNVPLDRWNHIVPGDMRSVDPTVFWVHGTSGEKLKVSIWS